MNNLTPNEPTKLDREGVPLLDPQLGSINFQCSANDHLLLPYLFQFNNLGTSAIGSI